MFQRTDVIIMRIANAIDFLVDVTWLAFEKILTLGMYDTQDQDTYL